MIFFAPFVFFREAKSFQLIFGSDCFSGSSFLFYFYMKKRIFVALDISEQARGNAADFIKKLRERFPKARAAWDKPEKLHLTMKFLGEIEEESLKKLQEAVEKTSRELSPFKLQIAGTEVFPSPGQARVLWLGVGGELESVRRLNEILEAECESQGFMKEKRKFKAHLTIARLKERAGELAETHLREKFEPVEFEVSELTVYQSELRPTGSVYSVVSKHKFKQSE
jgi:RNA 2',3'-cyclic 3'-phosphodiesterase